MKTATRFFPLMMAMFLISLAANVNAQGRGHHKKHEREHQAKHVREDHHDKYHHRDHKWQSDHHRHVADRHVRHHYDRHAAHYHDHHCSHARIVIHYHERPRYVYYRDYDVYYDVHQHVYITWSGRNWAVSASLPVVLHRVDRHRAVRMEVDYDHDDLTTYLTTGRPVYRRIYTGS